MRILLLLPRPLLPADAGGKIRSLNIFSRLAKRIEIHALSLADPEIEADAIAGMRDLFHSYTIVPWHETQKGSLSFFGELLSNRFSSWPYSIAKYKLREVRETAQAIASRLNFDLIFCDFLPMAAAMLDSTLRPRVVCEHNVEFLLRRRMWSAESHPLKKVILKTEWERVYAVERKVCQTFDHVLAVSDLDSQTFRQEFGIRSSSAIPTGVDTEFFAPSPEPMVKGNLVFVGSMDWYPNEEGVLWFLQEVYPKIRKNAPHVAFTIVGRNPTPRLRRATEGDSSVQVTGRVDDVRPYTSRAEVVLVPLQVGGGTRIKIPEAMAMAKPIVSTTIGAEGLNLQTDRELVLADEPADFARAVLDLLSDPARQLRLGQAARKAAVEGYGWDMVVHKIEKILVSAATGSHDSMPPEIGICSESSVREVAE